MSQWKSGRLTKRDDKNQVIDVIREDRRLTVRELGDMLGIGNHLFGGVSQIFRWLECVQDGFLVL